MKASRLQTILQVGICALALLLLPAFSYLGRGLTQISADFSVSIYENENLCVPPLPPDDWWAAAQNDIHQREYHVTWQESLLFPGASAGYQAPNRTHNLRIGFLPTGVYIVPRVSGEGESWTFGLTLTGFSQSAAMRAPALSIHENQVAYLRGSLSERYTNSENGLEQELLIPNSLSPSTLSFALTGDLTPRLADDGRVIEFTAADGVPTLRYSLLQATDAIARLSLSPGEEGRGEGEIRITVDNAAAASPITIRARITALPSSADWIGESDQADAGLGYALSTAGDVDGDGFSDLVVGAPGYDGGQLDEGAIFLYHGGANGLSSSADWTAESDQENAHLGQTVSIAGDVNGDGHADIIVGAPDYDSAYSEAGAAFVYHGSSISMTLGLPNWFTTGEQKNAHLGSAVSTAGDLNGDGYTDVIVGAPDYDGAQSDGGAVFAYYGSSTGLTIGSVDWLFTGDQLAAHFGAALGTAGDVNGDGYADVVIGAPGYASIVGTLTFTDTGRVYVYHGAPTGLITSTTSWIVESDQAEAHFGAAVSTAGDVNGDGYTDVIVGAPWYDWVGAATFTDTGRVYVYHGGPTGMITRTASWTAEGNQANAHLGAAVSVAGDVNADGYADVIVGAPDYDDVQLDEGAAFVYHGGATGLSAAPAWVAHPTDQTDAHFGAAVSAAGDVNGDGHSDLVMGAPGYGHGQDAEGGAFVYHGGPSGLPNAPSWRVAGQRSQALIGWSVSTAGDVNGDGYDDVIVGAPRYDQGQTEEGIALLYTGGPDGPATNPTWIGESDQEWAWFGQSVAAAGDVNGDGYGDIIVGAPRYDNEWIDDGKAFVYYGGPAGLAAAPSWTAPPDDQGSVVFGVSARFGVAVSTAGDVNGDGFADVIVTANGYDAEETNEGAAFVYHGGPAGLAAAPAWTAHPTDQAYANFGESASTAGDVNGDGYSDVIVGAPWYDDNPDDGIQLNGTAFVYHGSPAGLLPDPDWMLDPGLTFTNPPYHAQVGAAVSTAGDVNGDGYSDVIVGAYMYPNEILYPPAFWNEGAALVYYGSQTGLTPGAADWMATGGARQAKFGISVSTAGDVNGDGYSDVVVGASNYDAESQAGAAFVYHGGPTGLTTGMADWIAEGNQYLSGYGFAVSTAGDVNGDGYSDIIVGAPTYNAVWTDAGAAFVYLGNNGGLPTRARQLRSDNYAPIAPLGRSNSANQVHLQLAARSPLGREPVALQWQLAPLGTPFTATSAFSGASPFRSSVMTSGVVISQTVNGLTAGNVYRWRVRLLYHPANRLGQTAGRWMYLPWNGPQEADFRTPRLLTPDRSSTILPGRPAVYTHTLTNPISETQTFTLTAVSSQSYTVTISTSSGRPTITLPAFAASPVTVTVQIPPSPINDTDTTTITAASHSSGYDTVYDVTTIQLATAADPHDVFLPLILRGPP